MPSPWEMDWGSSEAAPPSSQPMSSAPWDRDWGGGEKPKTQRSFTEKLGETWPARLAKTVYSAVTLPGDVAQGNVSITGEDGRTNPQVIDRSFELAGVASPGSVANGSGRLLAREAASQPVPASSSGQSVVDAAARLSEGGNSVSVPRAIASDSMAVQRIGQGVRNIPVVGDAIPKSVAGLTDDLGNAVRNVADEFGSGTGPNVANRIGRRLADDAERERNTATRSAQASDDALATAWQRDQDAAISQIARREKDTLAAARQATGEMSPQDMGQAVISRLRSGEQAAQARKNALYEGADLSGTAASVGAGTVGTVRSVVAQHLDDMGRVVDNVLTPASSKMMDEVQKFSGLSIDNKAVGAGAATIAGEEAAKVAVNIKGIEQVRKRLNAFSQAAANDADRSTAKQIIRAFDKWESDAIDNHLFSGSPQALKDVRSARDANREWRQRFYNDRDDADKIINKVVTGEVPPQEMANWLVGAGQIGAKGVSSRLLTRLGEVTGNDPATMSAIRGGIANRLLGTTEGVTEKAPATVADTISEFFNGSGRDVARRLFSNEQRQFALEYANTIRRAGDAREIVTQTGKMTKPSAMEVGVGPMEDLARSILGRGGKTDEALFSAIDAYAKSGGRGDVQTLASIVRTLPQQDRGDLAGSIIRQLGVSPRTGQFSPDVFASQWQAYTPQAKAILFGNAGPHRQALDDIMTISQRLKTIGQRFGNPSGTAQQVSGFGLGTSAIGAGGALLAGNPIPALTLLTSVIGGATAAKVLAAPATASSAAKWARSYAAAQIRPSPATLAAYQTASRNLINTAQSFGSTANPGDFMRALQGGVPARAEDE